MEIQLEAAIVNGGFGCALFSNKIPRIIDIACARFLLGATKCPCLGVVIVLMAVITKFGVIRRCETI
jgi:hypothetical protein